MTLFSTFMLLIIGCCFLIEFLVPQNNCTRTIAVRIVFFHFESNSWAIIWNFKLNWIVIVGLKSHQ